MHNQFAANVTTVRPRGTTAPARRVHLLPHYRPALVLASLLIVGCAGQSSVRADSNPTPTSTPVERESGLRLRANNLDRGTGADRADRQEVAHDADRLIDLAAISEEAGLPERVAEIVDALPSHPVVLADFFVHGRGTACMLLAPVGLRACDRSTSIDLPPDLAVEIASEISHVAVPADDGFVVARLELTLDAQQNSDGQGINVVATAGRLISMSDANEPGTCEQRFAPGTQSRPMIDFGGLVGPTDSELLEIEYRTAVNARGGYVPTLSVRVGPGGELIGHRLFGPLVDPTFAQALADMTGLPVETISAGPCA